MHKRWLQSFQLSSKPKTANFHLFCQYQQFSHQYSILIINHVKFVSASDIRHTHLLNSIADPLTIHDISVKCISDIFCVCFYTIHALHVGFIFCEKFLRILSFRVLVTYEVQSSCGNIKYIQIAHSSLLFVTSICNER